MFLKNKLIKYAIGLFYICFTLTISGKTLNAGDIYLPLIIKPCPDYFDDFSNPGSGWEVTDDGYVKTEYLNGEYRILLKQYGYKIVHPNSCPMVNYSVEADLRLFNGIGDTLAIIFGASSKSFDKFYVVSIYPNETLFEIAKFNAIDKSGVMIVEMKSTKIFSGGSLNHLKVNRYGNTITVFINGIKMGTWIDEELTGNTYYGLGTVSGEGLLPDARFDNFKVTNIMGP